MTNLQSAQLENMKKKKNRRDVNYSYQCTETSFRHHVIVFIVQCYNNNIITHEVRVHLLPKQVADFDRVPKGLNGL